MEKSASLRQWTLCKNPSKFHRMTLRNQGWFLAARSGNDIRMQFMGSIWKPVKAEDKYFGKQFPMHIKLNDSMPADCLVKMVK